MYLFELCLSKIYGSNINIESLSHTTLNDIPCITEMLGSLGEHWEQQQDDASEL